MRKSTHVNLKRKVTSVIKSEMKKLLSIITFFFVLTTQSYSSSNEDMQWFGSCYIEYDGKIIVNNEICSIRQNGFSITPSSYKHIDEADNFQIVAVRDVPCDDVPLHLRSCTSAPVHQCTSAPMEVVRCY